MLEDSTQLTDSHKSSLPTSSPSQNSTVSAPKRDLMMVGLLVLTGIVLFGSYFYFNKSKTPLSSKPGSKQELSPSLSPNIDFEFKKFQSSEEFLQYMQDNNQDMGASFMDRNAMMRTDISEMVAAPAMMMGKAQALPRSGGGGSVPDRVSTTNVQVQGIDEPDIVKTNGKQIFLSRSTWNRIYSGPVPMGVGPEVKMAQTLIAPGFPLPIQPPIEQGPQTEILSAFPPEALAKIANLDKAGSLLLHDKTLIVFDDENNYSGRYDSNYSGNRRTITAYNISDPAKPTRSWQIKLEENIQLITSRLQDGQLFLITQSYIANGCPVVPLLQANGEKLSIACPEIYYPSTRISNADSTYTIVKVDPTSGAVTKSTTLVGSGQGTTIYMSPSSLYLSYRTSPDMLKILIQFAQNDGKEVMPASVVSKLQRLEQLDISIQAKSVEMNSIISQHRMSLTKDDGMKYDSNFQNLMQTYLKNHSRELESTLIAKLDTDSLTAEATGSVPGSLLNQFAMDEYQDHLRVATTVGNNWTQFGRPESFSDVYVLDSALRQSGVVADLGKGEKIYSVRFMQDRGYVVTFKQTDPFYVLDLRNASDPKKLGELKIPGFSSYLHQVADGKILGVGSESGRVKLSLFDVTNPTDPREASKYQLDDWGSEVAYDHHAFLHDPKHQVFFIPGSKGAYIFSYAGDQLSLVKTLSQNSVKRALFINDYLYILGEQGITILDEKDWQVIKTLEF